MTFLIVFGNMLNHLNNNIMTSSIIILIMYYIIAGLVTVGRVTGEKYKWYDKLLGFLFGWFITPILIGILIRKHI